MTGVSDGLPELLPPMLPSAGSGQAPVGPEWVIELAWTGHRCIAYVEPGRRTRLLSSGNVSMTAAYPELGAPLEERSPPRGMILDGTIVARGEEHAPRASRLKRRSARFHPSEDHIRAVPVDFQVADLLWLDGHSTVELPYRDRRTLLEGLGFAAAPIWTTSPLPVSELESMLRIADGKGVDALHARHRGFRYRPGGRSPLWVKVPVPRTRQVVVGGWTPTDPAHPDLIASLLLGVPGPGGLRYVGRVGVSGDERDHVGPLRSVRADRSPFLTPLPDEAARAAIWATPRLVGLVEFTGIAQGGRLRLPRWRGLLDEGRAAHVDEGRGDQSPHDQSRHDQSRGPGTRDQSRGDQARWDDGRWDDGRWDDGRWDDGRWAVPAAPPPARIVGPARHSPIRPARPTTAGGSAAMPDSAGPRAPADPSRPAVPAGNTGPAGAAVPADVSRATGPADSPVSAAVSRATGPADSAVPADVSRASGPADSPVPAVTSGGVGTPAPSGSAPDRHGVVHDPGVGTLPAVAQPGPVPPPAAAPDALDAAATAESRRLEQHFVYNALNTIAALIRTDPARARELLFGFADLSRAADRSGEATTTLGDELDAVRHYLQLEQARFGARLRVELEVDTTWFEAAVAPMRVLAAVRDAVQRHIEPRPQGGMLSIRAQARDDRCAVTVTAGSADPVVLLLPARHPT